jgi:hypothetical protein
MLSEILGNLDRRMSVAIIYLLFGLVCLVAAIVLFGILHSSGALRIISEGYITEAEFGGSFVGFLTTLVFLVSSYNSTVERQRLFLSGNVFWKDGQPVSGATVFVEGSELVRQTNPVGHFQIEVPDHASWMVRASFGEAMAEKHVSKTELSQPINLKMNKIKSAITDASNPTPRLETHHVENRSDLIKRLRHESKAPGDDVA